MIIKILCALTLTSSVLWSISNSTEESTMATHHVIQKSAVSIIGIECRTSNDPDAGPVDIPHLWGRFYSEDIINRIPNKISHEVVALYCDYEGDYTQPYTFVIGCAVSSIDHIPEGLVAKTIPASSYAVFSTKGEYPASLIQTWMQIWNDPTLKRTYTGDFELYGEKFISGTPKELEVYIAVP